MRIPEIPKHAIEEKVVWLRNQHCPEATCPVPVVSLIEFDYGLYIDVKKDLKTKYDRLACLLPGQNIIYVDESTYDDPRQKPFALISIVKEFGMYCLHKTFLEMVKCDSFEKMERLINSFTNAERRWMNNQGWHFATELMVPDKALAPLIEGAVASGITHGVDWQSITKSLRNQYLAKACATSFGVPENALVYRIEHESEMVKNIINAFSVDCKDAGVVKPTDDKGLCAR